MNVLEDVQLPATENVPVFFTGLAENVTSTPKKALLCLICRNSLTSNSKTSDVSTNGTNSNIECENCCKNFENIKKAISFLSNSPSPTSSFSSSSPSLLRNKDPSSSGLKRRSLLPNPESVHIDGSYPNIQRNNSSREEEENECQTEIRRYPEMKRKNDFESSISKKPRYEDTFNVTFNTSAPDNADRLSKSIWQLFLDNKQTQEIYAKKMTLRDKLHEILLSRFPTCGLYVVGSSMTGLGANSSDMDMCLMLTDNEIDQEKEAKYILHIIYNLFSDYSFLLDVEVIYAKVPILRFIDSVSNIEVDLNINNSVGIRNTQLLSSYARIDKRLPPLVLLVKMWARHHGINDAKNNTLSSYSLVLMVIHYFQYGCDPPVLPCLQKIQPDKYQPHSDVRKLKLFEDLPEFRSTNQQNLGELFSGFLNYFSHQFDYFRSVMSVRQGTIIPKEIAMNNTYSPKNKKGHWKWVCIEEPFDLTNTACAVFKPGVFRYMKHVFEDSFIRLRRNRDLNGIIS